MNKNYLTILFLAFYSTFWAQEYLNESFSSTTFPPTNWTIQTKTGNEKWIYKSGQESALADSWTIEQQDTWLITPQLNLTSNAILRFKAKADELVPPDNLFVKISTTGNTTADFTTEILAIKVGENVTKLYQDYIVDLSDFTGKKIYVGFHHKTEPSLFSNSFGASGFYLDDIIVSSDITEDVELVSLVSPHQGDITGDKKVSILIKNIGGVNIDANKIEVSYTISNGTKVTETVPAPLKIGNSLLYKFSTLANIQNGSQTINVKVTTPNDNDNSNNTKDYTFNFNSEKSLDQDFSGANFLPIGWESYFVSGAYADRVRRSGNTVQIKSTSLIEANDMIVTPKTLIGNNYSLKFSINAPDYLQAYANNPNSIPIDELTIKVSETGNEIADFTTTVKTFNLKKHYEAGVYDEFNYKNFTVDLSAFSGKKIHIAFDYKNEEGFGISLNRVEVLPQSQLSTKITTKASVQIYPNPTSNFVTISNVKNAVATLYTMNGQQVIEERISENNNTISIQHLSKGVYFLRISKNNTITTRKIIKQ